MPVGYSRLKCNSEREDIQSDDNVAIPQNGEKKPNKYPDENDPADALRVKSAGRFKSSLSLKRPFKSNFEDPPPKKLKTYKPESSVSTVLRLKPFDMLNGYHADTQNSYGGRKGNDGKPPIATLSNLGNTCFLNSVLYTLRFTPNFLHNLHHLVSDLSIADQKFNQTKIKSSSLGRNFVNLANSGSRSWSSKDLLSLGSLNEIPNCKSKIQVTTEKMHEMYACLRAAEARDSCEPYQAETFLSALRNVNPIFEGNQQQDAHELLMCVLDSIRETCRSLQIRFNHQIELTNGSHSILNEQLSVDSDGPSTLICSKSSLGMLRKSWKNRKKVKTSKIDSPTKENTSAKPSPTGDEENGISFNEWSKNVGFDFVAEDFEGTTVLRTTCLECEIVTERKQTMCDISVPIPEDKRLENDRIIEASAVYQNACVTSEYLRDQNKYWCDECVRYNEARRSVTYETLPRLLVLQLKRFSGGMEKLTAHMPTPLTLACFCDTCCALPVDKRPHKYNLYSVIMHLGQTLTGGHYIAYTKVNQANISSSYLCCERDNKNCIAPNLNEKPNFMKNLFARNKNNGIAEKIPPSKRKIPLSVLPPTANSPPSTEMPVCSSMDCCGIKLGRSIWSSDDQVAFDQDVWLMCDDESVKPISSEEFDELLSSKPKIRSASTPYLLFYVKADSE